MYVNSIYLEGFKRFKKFALELNPHFNVIVGDNETGKSSILEAIGLVLTGQYNGRLIQYAIDPYLFNTEIVADYFQARQEGDQALPPRVLIEAYLRDDTANPDLARLKGTNNTKREDCPGVVLKIEVDSDYSEELKEYAADVSNPMVLPIEFYRASWRSFADNGITIRKLPFRATSIDTSLTRVYRGPDKYLSQVVNDVLTADQRRDLSLAYKRLRHLFWQESGVQAVNQHLEQQGTPATSKSLTVQLDMSSRPSWENTIKAHLDDLPFDCAGMGEQCRIRLRLAVASAEKSKVLLIEEPENHLSHSNLNVLLEDIQKDCSEQQVIITTHSAFVLNKLGIDNLRLISQTAQTTALTGLTKDTKQYFMKLPGYNTLRLILSKSCILVEGPSDELVVQRAYKEKYGKLPLEDGTDVISIGSLAFIRFLEIAALLNLNVCVVTDNDGDADSLRKKYAAYLNGDYPQIKICFDEDKISRTLESQLLKFNGREKLNTILGQSHPDDDALLKYMLRHKTDCALKLFDTTEEWKAPDYIAHAIERE